MDFNEISNTALSYYYLPPHLLRPGFTVCALCDVTMTSEFAYIDKAIKQ